MSKSVVNKMKKFIHDTKGVHAPASSWLVSEVFEQAIEYIDQLEAKAAELDRLKARIKEAEELYPYKLFGYPQTNCESNRVWQCALSFIKADNESEA